MIVAEHAVERSGDEAGRRAAEPFELMAANAYALGGDHRLARRRQLYGQSGDRVHLRVAQEMLELGAGTGRLLARRGR